MMLRRVRIRITSLLRPGSHHPRLAWKPVHRIVRQSHHLSRKSLATMSVLVVSVTLYLLFTVAIGLYASSRVHGSKDFMVAGRSLPLYMNFACVFATCFGAETLLSISATFVKEGLTGSRAIRLGPPCVLAWSPCFSPRAFYRMDLLRSVTSITSAMANWSKS